MPFIIFLVILFSSSINAIEPMDNYYSHDIIEAVNQAREVPHHYDYSNTYRYKRTTSQSIELNRLNLEELENTYLTIDGTIPDLNNKSDTSEVVTIDKEMSIPQQKSVEINIQQNFPVSSEYNSQYGNHKSSGVIHQGVMISTPRP